MAKPIPVTVTQAGNQDIILASSLSLTSHTGQTPTFPLFPHHFCTHQSLLGLSDLSLTLSNLSFLLLPEPKLKNRFLPEIFWWFLEAFRLKIKILSLKCEVLMIWPHRPRSSILYKPLPQSGLTHWAVWAVCLCAFRQAMPSAWTTPTLSSSKIYQFSKTFHKPLSPKSTFLFLQFDFQILYLCSHWSTPLPPTIPPCSHCCSTHVSPQLDSKLLEDRALVLTHLSTCSTQLNSIKWTNDPSPLLPLLLLSGERTKPELDFQCCSEIL